MCIVLDTNTLISGVISPNGGAPRKLLNGARNQTFDLCGSAVLTAELLDVLSREKFATRLALAVRRSCESGSFLVAAQAAPNGDEFAVTHIEALPRHGFPLMETRLAERDALGAFSKARLAFDVEVDDVGHFRLSDVETNLSPFDLAAVILKNSVSRNQGKCSGGWTGHLVPSPTFRPIVSFGWKFLASQ